MGDITIIKQTPLRIVTNNLSSGNISTSYNLQYVNYEEQPISRVPKQGGFVAESATTSGPAGQNCTITDAPDGFQKYE